MKGKFSGRGQVSDLSPRDAAFRLMCEIIAFTDRPDYTRPPSVRRAFEVLQQQYGINETEIFEHYGDWEEESHGSAF